LRDSLSPTSSPLLHIAPKFLCTLYLSLPFSLIFIEREYSWRFTVTGMKKLRNRGVLIGGFSRERVLPND
jgi:hypothetical protein